MKKILLTLAVLCSTFAASAQEAAKSSANEQGITELSTRLEKQEKRLAVLEKVRQYVKLSAFMQAQYDWLSDTDGNEKTGTSSFYLRRVRFTLAGDLYRGAKGARLDYRVYFDLCRLPSKNPILDMWIRYQPFKEFGIQLGQYKNPVTFEASISPSKYDFIDFSYVVSNLAKMGANDVTGLNETARDIGFQFFGGFIHREGYSVINYNVGLLNGSGINTKDNNKSKDIYGKLTIKPSKDLAMAAYYQWGEANLSKFDAEKYAEYGWTGSAEYVPMHRWGVGLNYDGKYAFARSEYIGGLTGSLASEGLYAEAGYRHHLPKNAGVLWAGSMVDYFCRNCFDYIHRDTKNAMIDMRYSICLGYSPIKYFRMQLAYSLEHKINQTFANNKQFGNGVKLMLTASF
jgi:hypothetical protein